MLLERCGRIPAKIHFIQIFPINNFVQRNGEFKKKILNILKFCINLWLNEGVSLFRLARILFVIKLYRNELFIMQSNFIYEFINLHHPSWRQKKNRLNLYVLLSIVVSRTFQYHFVSNDSSFIFLITYSPGNAIYYFASSPLSLYFFRIHFIHFTHINNTISYRIYITILRFFCICIKWIMLLSKLFTFLRGNQRT